MACATIHLAIAKKYLERHPKLNYDQFIDGTLYPDSSENKDESHFTNMNRGKDNISHVRGKVNLYNFLNEHKSLNDFELGWFLHLITDYLFFEECFTDEYLANISYENFCKDLYFAYNNLNLYLSEKYNIVKNDYKNYPNEFFNGVPYVKCLLSLNMVDSFIERVSSINIPKYIIKLEMNKKNIKP